MLSAPTYASIGTIFPISTVRHTILSYTICLKNFRLSEPTQFPWAKVGEKVDQNVGRNLRTQLFLIFLTGPFYQDAKLLKKLTGPISRTPKNIFPFILEPSVWKKENYQEKT